MTAYLLDTNIISHFVRRDPKIVRRFTDLPVTVLAISAISEAEILFGLAKTPVSSRVAEALAATLRRLTVLPWDRSAARCYGRLRADLERSGKRIGDLELLIAAHAISTGKTLVTADKSFLGISGLTTEDWTSS